MRRTWMFPGSFFVLNLSNIVNFTHTNETILHLGYINNINNKEKNLLT